MRKRSMASTMSSLRRSGTRLLRLTTRLLARVAADSAPLKVARVKVAKVKVAKAKVAKVKVRRVSGSKVARLAPGARAPGFSPNPGGLGMHTYVPKGLAAGAPLVVLLHGCGQEPVGFAAETGWRRLADRDGFALLMPEQMEANNRQRCFNWFRPADTGRDLGEVGSIASMVRAVLAERGCDPSRVYVTGLSAGGAMTACLLAAYPQMFAGGAVVAGLPAGSAGGMVGAMTRMAGRGADLSAQDWMARARGLGPLGYAGTWPRLSIWHGEADPVVAPVNGQQLSVQWTTLMGLDQAPVRSSPRPGVTRDSWGDVELWRVEGMGHVYPTAKSEGVAAAEEIARFWGICR